VDLVDFYYETSLFFLPTRQQFPDPPLQLDSAFQQRSIRTE